MNEITLLGRTNDDYLFKQFAARYDVPAYVRRARRVQEAFDNLVARCRKQREEWLLMVRVQVKTALALAGDAADRHLRQLSDVLELAIPANTASASKRRLARAQRDLMESVARFNRRWLHYLHEVNVGEINQHRADYNRYYLLEKECALRSARLARLGFQPFEPLTVDELLAQMPLLPST
jgi:hypothetical protein